jgi:hypothetical protein
MGELTGKSKPISYTQDKSFLGSAHQDVIYLGALSNNDICALQKNGSIKIINSSGTEIMSWFPHIEGDITALAIDESDEIYVLSSLKKTGEKKIRGKLIEFELPVGIACNVFNLKGELIRTMRIDSLKQVMGAKLYKDKLVISDSKNKAVGIFNKISGEFIAKMEGMRPCGDVLELPKSEELKDCKYMPFISDSEDNLYVGAGEKGLVKYVSSH